jgi:EpsI family protein
MEAETSPDMLDEKQQGPAARACIPWWRSVVIVGLASITAFFCLTASEINNSTEEGVILSLPEWVGGFEYSGQDVAVTEAERTILPKDTEFARKIYTSVVTGHAVNCQIVLSGGEKRSIHRPEICLPGQGWTIQTGHEISVDLKDGRTLPVMKLDLVRTEQVAPNESRKIHTQFLYWFVGKDKVTAKHYERILLTSWDRVAHNTNHRWAYIVVSSTVPGSYRHGGADAEANLESLKAFVREVAPEIMKPGVLANL